MKILAIDLWDKRSGLAYNFWEIIFTLPYVERFKLVWELKKIIKEKEIEKIVVWLPYDLYWVDNKQLDKTLKFIESLKKTFPKMIFDTIDERFTTFESYNILSSMNLSKNEMLQKKDSMSAYLILESYMNKKIKDL